MGYILQDIHCLKYFRAYRATKAKPESVKSCFAGYRFCRTIGQKKDINLALNTGLYQV